MVRRCNWAGEDPLLILYHDREWGVPLHDDRGLFEFLILEGFQAGLSWLTILKKRENFRSAFDGFDAKTIALYDSRKTASLMRDEGIVRNRAKIAAAVSGARAYLSLREEFGSFDRFIWGFVGGKPRVNRIVRSSQVPCRTTESIAMSGDLRDRGFNFVGPTICYAFMQATGMVNDHLTSCFRYKRAR